MSIRAGTLIDTLLIAESMLLARVKATHHPKDAAALKSIREAIAVVADAPEPAGVRDIADELDISRRRVAELIDELRIPPLRAAVGNSGALYDKAKTIARIQQKRAVEPVA